MTSEAESPRSWWEVPPAEFATAVRAYNERQKVLGESELTPEVRATLLDLETRQHRAASELPARKN